MPEPLAPSLGVGAVGVLAAGFESVSSSLCSAVVGGKFHLGFLCRLFSRSIPPNTKPAIIAAATSQPAQPGHSQGSSVGVVGAV